MSKNTQPQGRSLYTERNFQYVPRGNDPLRIAQNWEIDLYRQLNVYNPAFDWQAKAARMQGLPWPPPWEGHHFTAERFIVPNTPSTGLNTVVTGFMKDALGVELANDDERVLNITTQVVSNNSSSQLIIQATNVDGGAENYLEVTLKIGEGDDLVTKTLTLELQNDDRYLGQFSGSNFVQIDNDEHIEITFGAETFDPDSNPSSWIIQAGRRDIDADNYMVGYAGIGVPQDEQYGVVPVEGRLHSFFVGEADGDPIISIRIKPGDAVNKAYVTRNGDEFEFTLTKVNNSYVYAGVPPVELQDLDEGEFVTLEIDNV